MRVVFPGARIRLVILLLVLLTIALVGVFLGSKIRPAPEPAATPAPATATATLPTGTPTASAERVGGMPVGVDATGHFYRGNPDAPVKLEEFSDFQCPFCERHFQETEPTLDKQYVATGKIVHLFRNFPLTQIHPNALPAAQAAYCAGQQAPKYFWMMHDWLYANQSSWADSQAAATLFKTQALSFGVDAAKYDACLSSPATLAAIQSDAQEGAQKGVQGTPAFFVNDWFINGAVPLAQFQDAIAKAEQGQHPSATQAPAAEAAQPTPLPTADLSNVQVGVTADGHFYRGNPSAAVKLLEFSDFQCPYCERHFQQTEPLLDSGYIATGKVLHVFRNFPLEQIHPLAMPAAQAAYCAGQQAPKYFWELHDWLFANQSTWVSAQDAPAQFKMAAVTLGVDGAKFDACLSDPATSAAINRDLQDGAKMGVEGTPAFFVNDWFISGAQPIPEFQDKIAKADQGLHAPPTPTPLPPNVAPYDPDPKRPGFTYDGSPMLGANDAPLILIGWEDFKCTYCEQHTQTVEPVLREKYVNTGKLRIIFKFFPIYAPKADIAALCAADQGKFWEFHDLLFSKQAEWNEGDNAAMVNYAKILGLDEAKFSKCLKDAPGQGLIDADYTLGQQVGVRGTPYFLLLDPTHQTGTRIPGALAVDQFEAAIQGLLNPAPTATPAK